MKKEKFADSDKGFKTVIEPKNRLFDLHLKETFSYKDLIFLFVKRDFVAKYKQTILGPLWAVIQPLLTTVIFTLIFGTLSGLGTEDIAGIAIPGFIFYMSGTICWSYISSTISLTSSTFITNSAIMGKVYYPRLVSPIATTLSNLISFAIQFFLFIVVWIVYLAKGTPNIEISWWMLMLPLVVLQMMCFSMGIGIIISALTTKYRDLTMLVTFGLQLLQYLSPVVYGLAQFSDSLSPALMTIYTANPVTSAVLTFRYAMFGVGYFNIVSYLISWAISIVVLFVGLMLFSRIEKNFMDTV